MTTLGDIGKVIESEHGINTRMFALSEVTTARYLNVWRDKIGPNLVARVAGNPDNVKYEVERNALVLSLRNGGSTVTEQDLKALQMLGKRFDWARYKVLLKSYSEITGADFSKSEKERLDNAMKALIQAPEVKVAVMTEASRFAKVGIAVKMPHMTQDEKNLTYNIMGTIITAALTHNISYF